MVGAFSSIAGEWFKSDLTQVLERPSDDPVIGDTISAISNLYFLEGPWLFALCTRYTSPQLLLFDVSLSQQDARS